MQNRDAAQDLAASERCDMSEREDVWRAIMQHWIRRAQAAEAGLVRAADDYRAVVGRNGELHKEKNSLEADLTDAWKRLEVAHDRDRQAAGVEVDLRRQLDEKESIIRSLQNKLSRADAEAGVVCAILAGEDRLRGDSRAAKLAGEVMGRLWNLEAEHERLRKKEGERKEAEACHALYDRILTVCGYDPKGPHPGVVGAVERLADNMKRVLEFGATVNKKLAQTQADLEKLEQAAAHKNWSAIAIYQGETGKYDCLPSDADLAAFFVDERVRYRGLWEAELGRAYAAEMENRELRKRLAELD